LPSAVRTDPAADGHPITIPGRKAVTAVPGWTPGFPLRKVLLALVTAELPRTEKLLE
jgi:hypothetical protein